MIGCSFVMPSYTKTSPAFYALLCCLASSAKLRGNLGSSPDSSIAHLDPRSVARLSLLCWISSVKIVLKYTLKVPPAYLFPIYTRFYSVDSLKYPKTRQFTRMALISASPHEDESTKKEGLEFIHLEEQELAHRSPGNESPVYGIDEAHQKRVMCVLSIL